MTDPTIKSASARIAYTGSDGYRLEAYFSRNTPPEQSLLGAFEELSRILHLFGFGEQAMRLANEAAERVAKDRGLNLNVMPRAVLERAVRFLESGVHSTIAREEMANELRRLL